MRKLLLLSFFLSLIGFFNLFGINQALAVKQIFFIGTGFLVFFLIKKIGRNFISANVQAVFWLFIILLFFTLVSGLEVKGSKRWIDLYFFNFQASEIFKPFFILFFSFLLVRDFRIE